MGAGTRVGRGTRGDEGGNSEVAAVVQHVTGATVQYLQAKEALMTTAYDKQVTPGVPC